MLQEFPARTSPGHSSLTRSPGQPSLRRGPHGTQLVLSSRWRAAGAMQGCPPPAPALTDTFRKPAQTQVYHGWALETVKHHAPEAAPTAPSIMAGRADPAYPPPSHLGSTS